MNDVLSTIRRKDYAIQHIIGPFATPHYFATEEIANLFKIPIVSSNFFRLNKFINWSRFLGFGGLDPLIM